MSTPMEDLKELVGKVIDAITNGVKRIEYTSNGWEVIAYRVITSIRIDIKEVKKL